MNSNNNITLFVEEGDDPDGSGGGCGRTRYSP